MRLRSRYVGLLMASALVLVSLWTVPQTVNAWGRADVTVDISLPSDSTGIPGGALAVRIFAPASAGDARYADGAPVLIFVSGGTDAGTLRPALSQAEDVIRIVFLFPGGADPLAGRSSEGTYDHRGADSIAALRDVILYAAGQLTDVAGHTIDDVVPVPVLHDNIGLLGASNGGNIVIAVAAEHGAELTGHLRYVIQWESPVSSQIATVDLGRVRLDCPPGPKASLPAVNPRYQSYGLLVLDVDYSQLTYDASDALHPVFFDGTGDGHYTTVLDPGNGCQTPDLNLNGTLELNEDFPLSTFSDGVKQFYSRPVTQALADQSVFGGSWPAVIGTPPQAEAFWDLREAVRQYSSALTNIPDLEGMVLTSVVDHVQTAPDHPHIHQAFDGWDGNGAWVKINPARDYVLEVDPVLSSRTDLPDNAANAAPADWTDAGSYAFPDGLEEAYFAAAVHEMADRAHTTSGTPTPTSTSTPTPTSTPSPTPTLSLNYVYLPLVMKAWQHQPWSTPTATPTPTSTPTSTPLTDDAPPLYFFYAIHTHVQGDWFPYTDPGMTNLDEDVADNMIAAIDGIAQVLDSYGVKATWETVYGTAKGLCTYEGTDHVYQRLLDAGHEVGLHVHSYADYDRDYQAVHDVCGIDPKATSSLILGAAGVPPAQAQANVSGAIQTNVGFGIDVGTIGMSDSRLMQHCGDQAGVGNDMWEQTGNLMFPWRPDWQGQNVCADSPTSGFVLVDHTNMTSWTDRPGNQQADLLTDADFDRLRALFDAALDYMETNRPDRVAAWGFVTHIHEFAVGNRGENPPDSAALAALDQFLDYVDSKVAEGRVVYATASEIADLAFPTTAVIDTHVHLDGKYWESGPGGPSVVTDFESAAATALAKMDELGIQKSLLMPPPFSPEMVNSPLTYDYTDLATVVQDNPERFGFLGGGGLLNPMIHAVPSDQVTEQMRQEFQQRAIAIAEAGTAGFGEMTALHLSFFDEHPFLETPPDHELFLLLADIAASYDMPIDLHMEAVVSDVELRPMFGPPNPQPPDVVHANIDAFERFLSHNRDARIVWVHVGWDNTGDMTVELLRRLLEDHPNLYMSLKVLEHVGLQFADNRPVDDTVTIRSEWVELIADFPDRFVMGGDQFYGIPGKTPQRPVSNEGTKRLTDQLPDDLTHKVFQDNVRMIYRVDIPATASDLSGNVYLPIVAANWRQPWLPPTPPGQPADGPGGSDYSHGSYSVVERGIGNGKHWIYQPTDPQPDQAPVVVFLHGWGVLTPQPYQSWLEHLVRKGNIVIYPRYQATWLTPFNTFTENAIDAVKDALDWLESDPSQVQPDRAKFAILGHSYGGAITINMAHRWQSAGLPPPKAIMPMQPGTEVDGTGNIDSLSDIPSTVLMNCHVGADDDTAGHEICDIIWDRTSHIPSANRDYVVMYSDHYGEPDLDADHRAPAASPDIEEVDALDWYGFWKDFDALRDCAFYGANCVYGVSNTPEHRFMGFWSDGTPVQELQIADVKP